MASKITLTYFNGRGRAEAARWILKLAGVEFEDKRISFEEWGSFKQNAPTGQLPFITVDGKHLAQSGAIAHYLAQENGLNGSDSFEAAEIHMIWDSLQDVINAAVSAKFASDEAEKAKQAKKFTEEALPKFLDLVDKRLDGNKEWLVGSKISAADLAVACFFYDIPAELKPQVESKPNVSSLVKRVTEQPSIKTWIESRPETPF